MFLDEPFAALDPMLRERMRLELLSIRVQFDIPIVLVTHDSAGVEFFAEHLLVFKNGRVESELTPSDENSDSTRRNRIRAALIGDETDRERRGRMKQVK